MRFRKSGYSRSGRCRECAYQVYDWQQCHFGVLKEYQMKRVTDQSSKRRIISLTAPVRPALDASGAASLTGHLIGCRVSQPDRKPWRQREFPELDLCSRGASGQCGVDDRGAYQFSRDLLITANRTRFIPYSNVSATDAQLTSVNGRDILSTFKGLR